MTLQTRRRLPTQGLKALIWRTRWNLKFEEGIVRGAKNYDEVLMNVVGQNDSQGP